MNLMMPITINQIEIEALVDTAAMVTLVDYSLISKQQLEDSKQMIQLIGIGKQAVYGKLIENVEVRLGKSKHYLDVCATDVEDKVLLGLDIIYGQKGILNLILSR